MIRTYTFFFLPTLFPASNVEGDKCSPRKSPTDFQVGDSVIIKKMEIKQMKKLQKNHGEWDPKMEQVGKLNYHDNGVLILSN